MKLKDFFWEAFIKGISIESYLAYKEYANTAAENAGHIREKHVLY